MINQADEAQVRQQQTEQIPTLNRYHQILKQYNDFRQAHSGKFPRESDELLKHIDRYQQITTLVTNFKNAQYPPQLQELLSDLRSGALTFAEIKDRFDALSPESQNIFKQRSLRLD